MKNSARRRGCYPPKPKDLQNSSYSTKAEFNNCFMIHSKYFQTLKGENELYFEQFCTCPSFFLASAQDFRKTASNSTAVVGFLMFFSSR